MFNSEIEDYKIEILDLKKDNTKLKKDNEDLKIKLRKLQDSLNKKHKIIDDLIDPTKINTRRDISESGPSAIITLKEENEKLHVILNEKDVAIRKLQHELDASRAYIKNKSRSVIKVTKSLHRKETSRPSSKLSQSLRLGRSPSNSNIKSCSESTHQKMVFKQEVTKNTSQNDIAKVTPEPLDLKTISDDDESKADESQHEELIELHNYFKDIITEVKTLKESICLIRQEQEKTSRMDVELPRDTYSVSIEKLSDELRELKCKDVASKEDNLQPLVKDEGDENWSSSTADDNYGLVPKAKRDRKPKKRHLRHSSVDKELMQSAALSEMGMTLKLGPDQILVMNR